MEYFVLIYISNHVITSINCMLSFVSLSLSVCLSIIHRLSPFSLISMVWAMKLIGKFINTKDHWKKNLCISFEVSICDDIYGMT